MKRIHVSGFKKIFSIVTTIAMLFALSAEKAVAASSWSPTLLVNTESFQQIDSGDGTTDVELRFGSTTNTLKFLTTGKFKFSAGLSVNGNLSGSTLNVDGNAGIYGGLTVSGSTLFRGTTVHNGTTKVRANLSGSSLNIDGAAGFYGNLTASGNIATKANLTINGDSDTNDATLTFGNQTANQTIKYNNTLQKFDFSKNVRVIGNISGSTLQIDGGTSLYGALTTSGAITTKSSIRAKTSISGSTLEIDGTTKLRSQTYTWPNAQGGANTFLKNDGAGGLSWSAVSVGSGSGNALSLQPEYANAVYTASGATSVGQLTATGVTSAENYYRWTSTRSSLQDYWIAVRVQLPANFTHFEAASGVILRLRTLTTSAADNYITFRMTDTNGSIVPVGSNGGIVSNTANTFRNHTITNVTSGTYAAGGYIKLLIKVAAKSTGITDLGYINLRWANSTP